MKQAAARVGKQVTDIHNNRWGLIVDTNLKTSGTPFDELNIAFGFDRGNRGVDVLGHDVATVQQAAGHVLSVTGVAFHHLVGVFETRAGDFGNRQLLVVGLFGRDDRSEGGGREMDA